MPYLRVWTVLSRLWNAEPKATETWRTTSLSFTFFSASCHLTYPLKWARNQQSFSFCYSRVKDNDTYLAFLVNIIYIIGRCRFVVSTNVLFDTHLCDFFCSLGISTLGISTWQQLTFIIPLCFSESEWATWYQLNNCDIIVMDMAHSSMAHFSMCHSSASLNFNLNRSGEILRAVNLRISPFVCLDYSISSITHIKRLAWHVSTKEVVIFHFQYFGFRQDIGCIPRISNIDHGRLRLPWSRDIGPGKNRCHTRMQTSHHSVWGHSSLLVHCKLVQHITLCY